MQALDLVHCPLHGRRLIEASAGTGKTYTICLLYLRAIIERDLSVRDVLVVSFTNAATAELKERIRARLVETLTHLREGSVSVIDQGLADVLRHYKDQQRDPVVMQKQLAAAIASFDEAAIHTIHGFCKRVFDDAPLVTGMPLDLELTSDDAEFRTQLSVDLYREWLLQTQLSEATVATLWQGKTLTELQGEIKRWLAKPMAVPRWPTAGSTADAAERQRREARYAGLRLRWQMERAEILNVLRSAMTATALHASSYKATTVAEAAQQWERFLQSPNFEFARRPEKSKKECRLKLFSWANIESRIVGKKQLTPHAFFQEADAVLADIEARDQEAAEERFGLFQFVVREAPQRMAALKLESRTLSFDDLLKSLHDRLHGDPDGPLASEIRRRFPVALVDEFQDTDPLQYGIFDTVYGQDGTLLLVGDPKQAIYAFRNADLHVYLKARQTARSSYTLSQNQRSSGEYLKALNAIFGLNPKAFLLDGLDYHPLTEGSKPKKPFTDPEADRGALQLWTLPGGDGADVLGKKPARRAVALATAAEISRLLRGARAGSVTYDGRPLAAGDIAVIVPTHARGTEVRTALSELGIGAVELSRDSVYATDEAADLACILDAALAPNRAGLVRAALATNLLGYHAAAIRDLNADDDRLMAEFERFERYRTLWVERGIGVVLRSVMSDFGITERLLTQALGERRLTNLRQLIECMQAAAADYPAPDALRQWLGGEMNDETDDDVSQLRLESDRDLVQIVSIHASKGLEYPIVFCPSVWDDFLNGGKKRKGLAQEYHNDDDQLVIDYCPLEDDDPAKARIAREVDAERLRLLYVALSRAVHRAYLVVGPWKDGKSLKPSGRTCLQWLMAEGDDPDYADFKAATPEPLAVRHAWQRLTAACSHVRCAPLPTETGVPVPPPRVDAETLAARALHYPVPRARRVGSYSSLLHGSVHEGAAKDVDARVQETPSPRAQEPETIPVDDIRRFPRGARAGECIHAVFETVDFMAPSHWPAAIEQALVTHPPGGRAVTEGSWSAMLHSMLHHVLATPLAQGLTLNTVPMTDRLIEWEFSLPAVRLEAGVWTRLLTQYGYSTPQLRFATLEGYLRGFVDLIVRHEGRYYVIDWKSNVLGDEAQDYAPAALDAAMAQNGYHLQHLLYTVALHRWLRNRLPGYDYDRHMGGTRYLFIRAVRPEWPDAGVYADRPPRDLIEAMSALLDGEGALP